MVSSRQHVLATDVPFLHSEPDFSYSRKPTGVDMSRRYGRVIRQQSPLGSKRVAYGRSYPVECSVAPQDVTRRIIELPECYIQYKTLSGENYNPPNRQRYGRLHERQIKEIKHRSPFLISLAKEIVNSSLKKPLVWVVRWTREG